MTTNEDGYYRLCVVRHAPVADPADLEAAVETIVRALAAEDPVVFRLSGYSPAMQITRVVDGNKSWVAAFLSTSAISWNFGRELAEPTHELVFFNPETGPRIAVLRFSFVANGQACTGPGLMAELILGQDVAGPADGRRGGHLDKLFSILLAALLPDHGHLELPGHPDSQPRPEVPQAGWLTYLSRSRQRAPLTLKPPAQLVQTEAGVKIFATAALAMEHHGDIAAAIDRVREQCL